MNPAWDRAHRHPAAPPASTSRNDHGEWQVTGAIRQRWIEDATDTTCPFQPAPLTLADLRRMGWFVQTDPSSVPSVIMDDAANLGHYPGTDMTRILAQKDSTNTADKAPNVFDLIVGHGVLIAEAIFRKDGPHFSQVAVAMMREVADPQSLRHLYFTTIINPDTQDFLETMLYTPRNGLLWPSATDTQEVWHYNTPQYHGLLGTRIGKCAVNLILEIFPVGRIILRGL
ncbi:uncharacterized protein N7515_000015 [Penicillium bovifimosum]|uniref:Uncharacterized protein n=1 Tax=Penicillium bovifimosum TaxID=126998 RepID=A0A9W9LB25_9EURO|nr:uncharacterized protein N7515_000015 [Penicillium bovifimosum]KAJ5145451.1 hypothetical protein N7515_000015 [Penicillium bovifimosum]